MKQKRAVSVILLFDDKKRILLQHRDKNIAILPDHWSFFGGAIDKGESPKEAVLRETKEELEYDLTNPELAMTQKFNTEIHKITRYVYIEKYKPNSKLVLREGRGMAWYHSLNIKILKIDKFDLEAIKFVEKIILNKFKLALNKKAHHNIV